MGSADLHKRVKGNLWCAIVLPLLFVHGLLVGGAVLLWRDRRTDLAANVLDAALDLAAARGRLGEDAFDGRDAIAVSVAARVHVLQPGLRQRVLLGRQLLVELDEERQHALADLQDLRHQLGRRAGRHPARRRALGPHHLGGLRVAAVDDLLELPPALGDEAEHLSFSQVLRKERTDSSKISQLHCESYF